MGIKDLIKRSKSYSDNYRASEYEMKIKKAIKLTLPDRESSWDRKLRRQK